MDRSFDEISELAKGCKYSDCAHRRELGGQLDEEKYNNYLDLKKETEYYEMSTVEKRRKDRRFGEFLKKAKKTSINRLAGTRFL
ncbi:hypothetical protein HYV30_00830 [Candidatus Kaiserbacteria bacterium]|nr:hypothetical protein [Candidatus Kaiserbacteria bacterium]